MPQPLRYMHRAPIAARQIWRAIAKTFVTIPEIVVMEK